jgi:hypothetical protein
MHGLVIAAAIAASLLAQGTQAQEMRPITGLAPENSSAPFVRCAGLYNAVLEWGGAQIETSSDLLRDSVSLNLVGAALAMMNDGVTSSAQQASDNALNSASAATDLYLERFRRNSAAVGEAFGQDAMVVSDFNVCQLITEGLQEL